MDRGIPRQKPSSGRGSSSNLRTTPGSTLKTTTATGSSAVKRNRLGTSGADARTTTGRPRPQNHARNASVNATSSNSILKSVPEAKGNSSVRGTPKVRSRPEFNVTFQSSDGGFHNNSLHHNTASAKSSFSAAGDPMRQTDSVFNHSSVSQGRMTGGSGTFEKKDSRMAEIAQLKSKNKKLQDENEKLKAEIKETDEFSSVLEKDFPFERYDERRYFLLKAQLRQQTRQIRMLKDQLKSQKKLYFETESVIHRLCVVESDLTTKEQKIRDEFVKLIAEKSTEKKKRAGVDSLNSSRSDGEETKSVNILEECRKKLNEMKKKLYELEMWSREEFACALNRSNPFINPGELEYYTNTYPDVHIDLNKGKVLDVETKLTRLFQILISVQANLARGHLPQPEKILDTSALVRESAESMLLLGIPLEEPINNEIFSEGCSSMTDTGRSDFLPSSLMKQIIACVDKRDNKKKVRAFLEHLKVVERKIRTDEKLRETEIGLYKQALEHSVAHIDHLSKFVNRKLMLIDEHFKANIYEKFKDLYLIHKKAKMNDYGADYYSELFTTFGLYAEDMNEAFLKSLGNTPEMEFDLDAFQVEFDEIKLKVSESLQSWNSFVESFQIEPSA